MDDIPFPFTPYGIQRDFMRSLYDTIDTRRIGIFESPTGTGKTLSLLCASLHWLKSHEDTHCDDDEDASEGGQAVPAPPETKVDAPTLPDEPDWLKEFDVEKAEMRRRSREASFEERRAAHRNVLRRIQTRHRNRTVPAANIQDFPKRFKGKVKSPVSLTPASQEGGPQEDDESLLLRDYDSDDDNGAVVGSRAESAHGTSEGTSAALREARLQRAEALAESLRSEREEHARGAPERPPGPPRQIIVASRTHSQLAQLIREIRRTAWASSTRAVILAGRPNLCIHPAVRALASDRAMTERCLELRDQKKKRAGSGRDGSETKSVSARGQAKRGRGEGEQPSRGGCPFLDPDAVEAVHDSLLMEVHDVEDAFRVGQRHHGCPYYASRRAVELADLVAVPYTSLVHTPTRESLGLSLRGAIVIFDEAHNLIDAVNQAYAAQLSQHQVTAARAQLQAYLSRYRTRLHGKNVVRIRELLVALEAMESWMRGVLDNCKASTERLWETSEWLSAIGAAHINLFRLPTFIDRSELARKLRGFADLAAASLTEGTVGIHRGQTRDADADAWARQPLAMAAVREFLHRLAQADRAARLRVDVSKKSPPSRGMVSVKFVVLNPEAHIRPIAVEARSVVLAGGTMEPVDDVIDQLFPDVSPERFVRFSCGHVIPDSSMQAFALGRAPSGRLFDFTFSSRSKQETVDDLGQVVLNIATVVPGGMVVFLPSYSYESLLLDERWSHGGNDSVLSRLRRRKTVFREPRDRADLDRVMREYTASCRDSPRGAILFAVVGGKLSEGLNFSDELARAVVVVGLPYPHALDPELAARRERAEQRRGPGGGREYYDNLCMKAVNQSIGRAIRHQGDYACIVLVDQRYTSERVSAKLPAWIRRGLTSCDSFGTAIAGVARFFAGRRGRPGEVAQ